MDGLLNGRILIIWSVKENNHVCLLYNICMVQLFSCKAIAGLSRQYLHLHAYNSYNSLFSLSAGLILLFYLVFYIFLAGLFALTMYVMLQTLDDHKPTWQDRLATPGAVTNDTDCVNARHRLSHIVLNSLLCLCHSQAWWLDPKQMRPLRLSIQSRTLRAGTRTLRSWTSF